MTLSDDSSAKKPRAIHAAFGGAAPARFIVERLPVEVVVRATTSSPSLFTEAQGGTHVVLYDALSLMRRRDDDRASVWRVASRGVAATGWP